MELKVLQYSLTVCKVKSISQIDFSKEFYFVGRTDEELSLVCITEDTPEETVAREDGWRGFRIQGVLDFSLIGILSKISAILAEKVRYPRGRAEPGEGDTLEVEWSLAREVP